MCHEFFHQNYTENLIPRKVFTCLINDANVTDEYEIVTFSRIFNGKPIQVDIECIQYTGDVIEAIPNSIFTDLPSLRILEISYDVGLTSLKPSYFKNAKNLTDLTIKLNSIPELTADLFVEAPNLEVINLRGNHIKSVHRFAFSGLEKLFSLSLGFNEIKHLPTNTFDDLPSLIYLDLKTSCAIKTFGTNSTETIQIEKVQRLISILCTQKEEDIGHLLTRIEQEI